MRPWLLILAAVAGSVTLAWTAPGDDGLVGTATAYDLRYSTAGPITERTFWTAVRVVGEPIPAAAGVVQSVTVRGLAAGSRYWFALKTADEVANWSPISNVVAKVAVRPVAGSFARSWGVGL